MVLGRVPRNVVPHQRGLHFIATSLDQLQRKFNNKIQMMFVISFCSFIATFVYMKCNILVRMSPDMELIFISFKFTTSFTDAAVSFIPVLAIIT